MNDCTVLPDGSAFFIGSFPLPLTHWLYQPPCTEWDEERDTSADTPYPMLRREEWGVAIENAARWAIRGATRNGTELDFDPDAMVRNFNYALCGPYSISSFVNDTPPTEASPSYDTPPIEDSPVHTPRIVWVVGLNYGTSPEFDDKAIWEVMGIYDTEQDAVAACTSPYEFVGPLEMNVPFPKESTEWPGCYYPLPYPQHRVYDSEYRSF